MRLDPWIEKATAAAGGGLGENVIAPMPGQVIAVNTAVGDQVQAGDALVVMEAMKMEHSLTAPIAGEVTQVPATAGAKVADGELLVAIRPLGAPTEPQSTVVSGDPKT